jgi:hypothetical protein
MFLFSDMQWMLYLTVEILKSKLCDSFRRYIVTAKKAWVATTHLSGDSCVTAVNRSTKSAKSMVVPDVWERWLGLYFEWYGTECYTFVTPLPPVWHRVWHICNAAGDHELTELSSHLCKWAVFIPLHGIVAFWDVWAIPSDAATIW